MTSNPPGQKWNYPRRVLSRHKKLNLNLKNHFQNGSCSVPFVSTNPRTQNKTEWRQPPKSCVSPSPLLKSFDIDWTLINAGKLKLIGRLQANNWTSVQGWFQSFNCKTSNVFWVILTVSQILALLLTIHETLLFLFWSVLNFDRNEFQTRLRKQMVQNRLVLTSE